MQFILVCANPILANVYLWVRFLEMLFYKIFALNFHIALP